MRAMVLRGQAPIESSPLVLSEVEDPLPGPGEVRVRVSHCAICRTDLHVIEGDLKPERLPVIPGHQVIGTIDRLGPGSSRLKLGQRVGIAWLRSTCGRCEYCLSGKENLCEQTRFTGYHADGGFAELAVAPEAFCYEIPDGLPSLKAVPLLCAGIIGYRALERSRLPEGGALGIFGFGSSAHIVIQLAIRRGARVYVSTRDLPHQELARALGAAWAGGSSERIPAPLDSAILFAPAGELVPRALEALKRGGTLAVAGIHLSRIPELDYQRDLFFERDLRSVTANTRQDGLVLLRLAAGNPPSVRTKIYPLEAANEALLDLKQDRIQGTGVLEIRAG